MSPGTLLRATARTLIPHTAICQFLSSDITRREEFRSKDGDDVFH